MDERRSLAIQMLFGIVLCLRYGSNITTWNSKEVFILAATDGIQNLNIPPYVLCADSDSEASYLDLPDSQGILEESQLPPSKTFTRMAKVLLEIGLGECLDDLDTDTGGNGQQLWGELRKMVLISKMPGLMDDTHGLDILPYIAAADCCLNFTRSYEFKAKALGKGLDNDTECAIVENILFDEIIPKLCQKSCAPKISSMDAILKVRTQVKASPAAENRFRRQHSAIQRSVNVQSCQQRVYSSRVEDWAKGFFTNLEDFHDSFSSFVKRNEDSSKPPIRVAIIDTGIDKNHVEIIFDGKHIKDEWCFSYVGSASDFHDYNGHGTHCTSLVQKVAPDAEIYVLKVFSGNEFNLEEAGNIPKAIRHATEVWDVDIISMSFGFQLQSSKTNMKRWMEIQQEISRAIDSSHRQLFFAAAANEGENQPRAFPSTHPLVFCVHASDGNGNDSGINPFHEHAENNVMTLGVGITLLDDDEEVIKDGTSFATAIAAGLAASILDLTSRVSQLEDESKAALRTKRGMRMLFRHMSGPDKWNPRPFVVPWNYWEHSFWNNNPRGLDKIWAELDSIFNN
ncbi:hypothetical protein Daus18300_003922 [Diaporthe australafricana]|uniref:Peptidase S8/S53 domain-containing protein n=1 Tax=Diaporthe australafricana TaxID=127596 RepID=A0ABR3XC75_9PEZI